MLNTATENLVKYPPSPGLWSSMLDLFLVTDGIPTMTCGRMSLGFLEKVDYINVNVMLITYCYHRNSSCRDQLANITRMSDISIKRYLKYFASVVISGKCIGL